MQNRYSEAEGYLQKALTLREKQFGVSSRETAYSLGDLADLYSLMKRYEQAVSLFSRAIETAKKLPHPDDSILASLEERYQALKEKMEDEPESLAVPAHKEAIKK